MVGQGYELIRKPLPGKNSGQNMIKSHDMQCRSQRRHATRKRVDCRLNPIPPEDNTDVKTSGQSRDSPVLPSWPPYLPVNYFRSSQLVLTIKIYYTSLSLYKSYYRLILQQNWLSVIFILI